MILLLAAPKRYPGRLAVEDKFEASVISHYPLLNVYPWMLTYSRIEDLLPYTVVVLIMITRIPSNLRTLTILDISSYLHLHEISKTYLIF